MLILLYSGLLRKLCHEKIPNLVSLVPGPSTPSLMINNQLLNKSLFAAIGEIEKLKVEKFSKSIQ